MKSAGPDAKGSHVEHDQAEGGEDHQQGINLGVGGTGGLAAGYGLGYHSNLVKRQAAKDTFSQQSSLVQDFPHPSRWHPGGFPDLLQQALHQTAYQFGRLQARSDGIPDSVNEGHQALVHNRIDQLLAVVEVVMHHGGGKPGAAGYGREAGGGDALSGEERGGGVQ